MLVRLPCHLQRIKNARKSETETTASVSETRSQNTKGWKNFFLTLILFRQYKTMQFFGSCKQAANTLTNSELAEV